MTSLAELEAKNQQLAQRLTALTEVVTAERQEVQALLNGMKTQIQALLVRIDELTAGQLVSQEQLDSLNAAADATLQSAESLIARIQQISEPETA